MKPQLTSLPHTLEQILSLKIHTVHIGAKVTDFVHNILKSELSSPFTLELVDIASFNLPVFDEFVIPANVPNSLLSYMRTVLLGLPRWQSLMLMCWRLLATMPSARSDQEC